MIIRKARFCLNGKGMPVVEDPGILSPRAFAEEVFERFTNIYLGDTNLRLATVPLRNITRLDGRNILCEEV